MNPQIILFLGAVPDERVFGLDQQTIIQIGIQLLNICFLAAVLAILLYNPVRNYMRKRTDSIRAQLDSAGEYMEQANEMKVQYEKRLREIEMERDEILNSARRLAAEKSKQMLTEAKNEADAVRERAGIDIRLEQERVRDEMKQSIIEVSAVMAERLITAAIDRSTQDRLFDEAMAELEVMTWRN